MNELVFKTWNDDSDLTFYKDAYLSFAQCDMHENMSWAELLRFTSDAAVEDFAARNMNYAFLIEKGIIIVVSRISYHVIKMPKAFQQITLLTWEEAAQGPLCVRRYQIIDTNTKEILVTGFSLWTIVDFREKKLIPAKNYTYRPLPTRISDFDGIKPGKIAVPENAEKIGTHKIGFTDMDSNGHCNNSRYMNFVIDALPQEYQNKTFTDLRVNYSKEATYGDTIDLYGCIDDAAKKITVVGRLEQDVCFECELYW